jgi:hypothetical protein
VKWLPNYRKDGTEDPYSWESECGQYSRAKVIVCGRVFWQLWKGKELVKIAESPPRTSTNTAIAYET